MNIEVNAQKRDAQGTGASRRLRRVDKVPGIVYGGNRTPVKIELDHKEIHRNLTREAFHASILTLKLDGQDEQVLLRAFNMHPFKARVQHVDFQRVSKDKKIHMKVPLHFVNAEIAPGVKEQGGVVEPCDERPRHQLSAGRPARVHRGRSQRTGGRQLDPRARARCCPRVSRRCCTGTRTRWW